jgi:hypothetical protein
MTHTNTPVQDGPGEAEIVEEHRVADPHDEDKNGGTDTRGRRWYDVRPEPRRGTDLMGFNSTWWMALGWLILILLVVFPFPFWSW